LARNNPVPFSYHHDQTPLNCHVPLSCTLTWNNHDIDCHWQSSISFKFLKLHCLWRQLTCIIWIQCICGRILTGDDQSTWSVTCIKYLLKASGNLIYRSDTCILPASLGPHTVTWLLIALNWCCLLALKICSKASCTKAPSGFLSSKISVHLLHE